MILMMKLFLIISFLYLCNIAKAEESCVSMPAEKKIESIIREADEVIFLGGISTNFKCNREWSDKNTLAAGFLSFCEDGLVDKLKDPYTNKVATLCSSAKKVCKEKASGCNERIFDYKKPNCPGNNEVYESNKNN